jgi:hypothetical protein
MAVAVTAPNPMVRMFPKENQLLYFGVRLVMLGLS